MRARTGWLVALAATALVYAARKEIAAAWVSRLPLPEPARCDACGAPLDEEDETGRPHVCPEVPW